MARNETIETEELREIYGFHEKYDVTLACAFEPDVDRGCERRFTFYDSIGKVVERLGKKAFLPHKHADLNWSPEKIVGIINGIVIPTSDLVLAYIGINTTSGGVMLGKAITSGIPVSYMYEDESCLNYLKSLIIIIDEAGRERTVVREPGFRGNVYDLIQFDNDKDGLRKLELSLKKFYNL